MPALIRTRCLRLAFRSTVYLSINFPVSTPRGTPRARLRAARAGTSERATSREASSGKVMESASSRRMSWKSLWMNTTGRNTVTVVAVAATTARLTSSAPSRAACIGDLPRS